MSGLAWWEIGLISWLLVGPFAFVAIALLAASAALGEGPDADRDRLIDEARD